MASHSRSFFSAPRRRRAQAGAAIVETLFVVIVPFVAVVVALEITNFMRVYEKVSWTAEYGVRQASEGMGIDGMGNDDQRIREDLLKFTKILPKLQEDFAILKEKDFTRKDVDIEKLRICVDYIPFDQRFPTDLFQHCNEKMDLLDNPGKKINPGDFVRVTVEIPYVSLFPNFMTTTLQKLLQTIPLRATFTRTISASQ